MKTAQPSYSAIVAETVTDAPIMVEVTAPANLKAGFTFDAVYEGETFVVTVPTGGVTAGQKLQVPFVPGSVPETATGAWKDDLCACDRYGICSPSFINAACCPLILVGQVMTRLKLDWFANPAPLGEWSKSFMIMAYLTIGYAIFSVLFSPTSPDEEASPFYSLISFSYGVLGLILITKVRKAVREKYSIPEENCIGCEDFCCAFWCGCCTVSQLARQTADYDFEEQRFFTKDGIAPKETTPVIIV
jgi:Cys-rich protein (TIGR01571 family)